MNKNGYKTGKIPATHNFDVKKLISNWSHRHIAYIAGIGTFGINNMLITKNGCCGRFGSIITNYELKEYKQINEIKEKCLYKINGSCGICQKKCIVNAYENNNYDRHKCYKQCLENAEYHKKIRYLWKMSCWFALLNKRTMKIMEYGATSHNEAVGLVVFPTFLFKNSFI
jgi:epoxyqueuosine reductase QueG